MWRRPSGPASEEEQGLTSGLLSATTEHGDQNARGQLVLEQTRTDRALATDQRSSFSHLQTHGTSLAIAPSPQVSIRPVTRIPANDITPDSMLEPRSGRWRSRLRNPWACSLHTFTATLLGFAILFLMMQSFLTRQMDTKGCEMSYMRPAYFKYDGFDTEHTRFASKYSLYLYREGGIDDDSRVKGVPVLFIPGNAGSYKQVRSLAAESAYYYQNTFRHDESAKQAGKRPLDFFTVDFNEDFTAFHGQTMLDQAEYLNDAISFILTLYHTSSRSLRDSDLPDPTSVIVVGHSMGGMVARTMLTMPNYQSKSINTIVTLAAPHARAPASFDGDIVRTYQAVNDYWRHAYSQKSAIDNPLWHVTLISIAGGGLDTIVPSDYASLASLVPETHGFTVFTSSIPNVWTGMDHLAITWCDQARKSIVRALYEIIDASRPMQTVPRAKRMRGFKTWFLTGLEGIAEKTLPHKEPKTLLTLEESSNISSQVERLNLRSLGQSKQTPTAHLLPIPPQGSAERKKFTLLTNVRLDSTGENGALEVLFCSVFPLQAGQSAGLFQMNMDLSGDSSRSTRLACKNAASDVISLPASTRHATFPFKTDQPPFSYLQYDPEDLSEYQFVAVVDKAGKYSSGWVLAEFTGAASAHHVGMSLQHLLVSGLSLTLPAQRPLVMEVEVPAFHSSLLAYRLHIGKRACESAELFTPLLRQYVTEVFESKYFVNVRDADINLHGVAPYMPPPSFAKHSSTGLSLQVWSDPTCDSGLDISVMVDVLGSLGKLWMRYRIVFAAFPLLVVALVLRQQFSVYDETGIFMTFAQGLNECVRTSLPFALLALVFLSLCLGDSRNRAPESTQRWPFELASGNITGPSSHTRHELLLGSEDAFFWFLVPLFGTMCVAICVALNYVVLGITFLLATIYGLFSFLASCDEDDKQTATKFAVTSTRQRLITTCVLLCLVSTAIPYHFVYVVLCIVQFSTCARGYRLAKNSVSRSAWLQFIDFADSKQSLDANYNFHNYAHSILVLMIWILPINLPVLVVWVRNLVIHWLTPFSSHHNILSIMPFIVLIETLSTGHMVPRVQSRFRALTNVLLFSIGAYAAMYGVTYAYVLHHLANIFCGWLVAIHFDVSSFSVKRVSKMLNNETKKRP